jgi:hypothetical protein
MNAKKEALEIRNKFIEPTKVPNIKGVWVEDLSAAKQCSIILVNEILKVLESELLELYIQARTCDINKNIQRNYLKVKEELEKLPE